MLAVSKRALERSRSFSVAMLVAMFVYVITHLRKKDHAQTFQRERPAHVFFNFYLRFATHSCFKIL